jgi:hypothetical protein
MEHTLFCPVHGPFQVGSNFNLAQTCPSCGREGEIIHTVPSSQLEALTDPDLSLESLLALRQIADSVVAGLLTAEHANSLVTGISAKFSEIFKSSDANSPAAPAVVALVGAVITARSRRSQLQ